MTRASGIRTATAADLPAALELLRDAALPVADLCAERLALVAYQEQEIRGVIGLESFENPGLLRSLVVSREARGNRLGASPRFCSGGNVSAARSPGAMVADVRCRCVFRKTGLRRA